MLKTGASLEAQFSTFGEAAEVLSPDAFKTNSVYR